MAGTDILTADGTAIVWSYGGTNGIQLGSLAHDAAAQGKKADLGATRAELFDCEVIYSAHVAPASSNTVEVYWSRSTSGVAGTKNAGGCSGTNAAYTGTAGDSIADSVKQLDFMGALPLTSDANTQQITHFTFAPRNRYGMPVLVNSSGHPSNTINTESQITITPLKWQSQ